MANKKEVSKKDTKKNVISKAEQKKEEKVVKEVKKEEKKNTNKKEYDKLFKFYDFIDKYRLAIYGAVGGVLVTILVVILIWPERIAKLKDGTEPVVKIDGMTINAELENGKNYLLGAYESEKAAQEEFNRVNALIGAGHLNIVLGS